MVREWTEEMGSYFQEWKTRCKIDSMVREWTEEMGRDFQEWKIY
jgi:hypothetical protein